MSELTPEQATQKDEVISHVQAIRLHFIKRARQRFRMRMNEHDYKILNDKIKNNQCVFEKYKNESRVVRLVYKNKDIRCVFSTRYGCLVTAIPAKRITFEKEVARMIDLVSHDEREYVYRIDMREVRISKRLNYVKILKKKKFYDEFIPIVQWGYPDNLKKIDEILTYFRRNFEDKRPSVIINVKGV